MASRWFGFVIVLLVMVTGCRDREEVAQPAMTTAGEATRSSGPAPEIYQGFLYGRVTDVDGVTYEGRLRWGSHEEAFWGDYFNGFKDVNPWAAAAPAEKLEERRPIEIFGIEIAQWNRQIDLGRPLMVRFGDVARLEARSRDILVTLKSGTVFELDRNSADDLADGVRVWDGRRGVVDLDEWKIRHIEFLPTRQLAAAPDRLHGTVRTAQGDFTGFVQWNREKCVGTDELVGHTAKEDLRLRFDTIRSIARRPRNSFLVTLLDGNEIVLAGAGDVGAGNRGLYVEDQRYGRVLVSWKAFERVDFSPAGSGPAFGDFPPGHPLTGSVTAGGRRLVGRLVFDLDESETTETFDAPFEGVDYTIPFGLIASIAPPVREERSAGHARVILHSSEELQLECTGDLGERNAGMLIFANDPDRPEYVPWIEVERIDLDRPLAMYPPLGGS